MLSVSVSSGFLVKRTLRQNSMRSSSVARLWAVARSGQWRCCRFTFPAVHRRATTFFVISMPVMTSAAAQTASLIGKEVAVPVHLQDGREFEISTPDLISFGQTLFLARWTSQEGQGRPFRKGTGDPYPIWHHRSSFQVTSTVSLDPMPTHAPAATIPPLSEPAVIG